jgi:hypothetical protein
MTEKHLLTRLLLTDWVSSYVGRARQGDLHDQDAAARAAAWAQWALKNFAEFKGLGSREYVGIVLPGAFHDPRGTMPKVAPHLEIQQRTLEQKDATFPDRLAQAGNGLLFPWWVFSEVAAVKRALFPYESGDLSGLVKMLGTHRPGLVSSVEEATRALRPRWDDVEAALLADPEEMLPLVTGYFSTDEVAAFLPAAKGYGVEIQFDGKLRESQGVWSSRRVGVWRITGSEGKQRFAMGVVTPRLTSSSLFSDPLFAPARESSAALLVRGLLLRRIVARKLGTSLAGEVTSVTPASSRHLRAVVARPGSKLPQASVRAAVHFIQTHSTSELAWESLREWAGDTYLLTVGEQAFKEAFERAATLVRRAEQPERDDIDTILPICWDEKSRVIRATFTLPYEEDRTSDSPSI